MSENDSVASVVSQYRQKINETPVLLSLLYDADLLPEQIITVRGAVSMAAVCIAYDEGMRAARLKPPATHTPG